MVQCKGKEVKHRLPFRCRSFKLEPLALGNDKDKVAFLGLLQSPFKVSKARLRERVPGSRWSFVDLFLFALPHIERTHRRLHYWVRWECSTSLGRRCSSRCPCGCTTDGPSDLSGLSLATGYSRLDYSRR